MAYKLNLRVEIFHVDDQGRMYSGDRLQVSEEVTVDASDFLEIAKILGQFHELTQHVRAD